MTYVATLGLFIMTYTAFRPPYDPRVAMAVSSNLVTWTRLGPVEYGTERWENLKVGAGAPPVRLPYGWLLLYHGVSGERGKDAQSVKYWAGVAVPDIQRPTKVLYRSAEPLLEPSESNEVKGTVDRVAFPTAVDRRPGDRFHVYYGAADSVIAVFELCVGKDGRGSSLTGPSSAPRANRPL